jgi:quercetin dioxygenase-like cupin family protein
MKISRNNTRTTVGASSGFTGLVFADRIAEPTNGSRVIASSVHFAPGARTAWHTHPCGQTIWIAEGVAVVQRRGGPIEIVHPGDCVFFEPDEDHWHGAAPDRFMTHISITETDDDGNAAAVGAQVTDNEYAAAPHVGSQEQT